MLCLYVEFKIEIINQDLLAFSDIDFALRFGEFDLFVRDFDFRIDLKNQF